MIYEKKIYTYNDIDSDNGIYKIRLLEEPRVSTSASTVSVLLSHLHKNLNLIIFLPETFHGMGKLCIIISTLIKRMLQGFYGNISSYWFILYRVVKNSTI